MLGLRISEQLLSLLAMLSFGWALRWLFITPGRPPLGVWALTVATAGAYVLFSIYLWANPRAEVSAGLALLGFSLSILLFWWTVKTIRTAPLGVAYAGRQSPQVQSQGPYALIRHPFYGSYILFWAATAVGVGGWQWAVALGFLQAFTGLL